uniref:Guanylate cyclase domain-containing protein n=1 Tax=Percolomonas cosmopolitus TaxID=63605 RepID=A0A7S1KQX8_9EUKA|mmetsp:Transcript_5595/g.21046  ORF Transcript_5595/g.21046 Transcript_5595/m.21046 type:complete len:958 (+) Transcript_5595:737-3610(+)
MPFCCPELFYSSKRVARLLEEEESPESSSRTSPSNPFKWIFIFRSLTCTILSLVVLLAFGIFFVSLIWIIAFAVSTTQLKNGIREQTFQNIQSYTEHSLTVPRSITAGLIGFSYSRFLMSPLNGNVTMAYPYMYDFLYQTYKHSLIEVNDFLNIDYIAHDNNNLQYVYFAGDQQNGIQYHLVSWDGITKEKYSVYDVVDFETGQHSNTTSYEYTRSSASDSEAALLAQWTDESTKIPPNTFVYHEPFLDCEANPYCVLFMELTFNVFRDDIWVGTIKTSMGGAGISEFLSKSIRSDATAFIIDRHKNEDGSRRNVIVASSTVDIHAPVNPLANFVNGQSNRPVLYPAAQFPDNLVADVSRTVLEAAIPNGGAYNFTHSISHDVDVGNIFLESSELDWLVVHVLPNTAFIQTPLILGIIGVIMSIFFTIVALVIGIVVSCMIAIPLRNLMKQMQLIENMKLDSIKKEKFTYFSEVRKIQRAFYFMKEKLEEWKSFLPAHLLPENDLTDEMDTLSPKKNGSLYHGHSVDAGNAISPHVRKYQVHPGAGMDSGTPADCTDENKSHQSDAPSLSKESTQVAESPHKWAHTPSRTLISNTLVKKQRFNRLLEQKSVCLMHIRITGFDKSISGMFSPKDFIIQHGTLMEEMSGVCRRLRGVLIHFDANDLVFGFNATLPCSDYAKKACSLVETVRSRLHKLNSDWKREAKEPLNVTIGIATGEAYVGNVGSHSHKKMTVFGHPRVIARLLCDRAEDLGVDCLICDRTQRKIPANDREAYQTRPLDVFLCPRLSRIKLFRAHQLLEYVKFEGDEWMYEMQITEKMRKYNPCIEAFEHFENDRIESAISEYEKFETTLEGNQDRQLERLLQKIGLIKDQGLAYKQLISIAQQRPLYQGHNYISLLDMKRETFMSSFPSRESISDHVQASDDSGEAQTQKMHPISKRQAAEVMLNVDDFLDVWTFE